MLSFQDEYNQKEIERLKALGFNFDISSDGYAVRFGEKWIDGAGVKLPREKPLHWRHRIANGHYFTNCAVIAAQRSKYYKG